MNRFEHLVHTARREEGELAVDRFNELWAESQTEMLGDAVEVTEGYRTWWSYVPHFISTPGYVYAYAYGQLLALSVYARYEAEGDAFVPAYLDLLRAGGSRSPEELGADRRHRPHRPGLLGRGPRPRRGQLDAAEEAARATGRVERVNAAVLRAAASRRRVAGSGRGRRSALRRFRRTEPHGPRSQRPEPLAAEIAPSQLRSVPGTRARR